MSQKMFYIYRDYWSSKRR